MSLPPSLPQQIQAFLIRPDVDLKTVSLKQIRRHLAEVIPELDVKSLKEEINQLIIPIFTQMQEAAAASAQAADSAEAQNTDEEAKDLPESSPPTISIHPTGLSLPVRGIPGGGMPSSRPQVSTNRDESVLPISHARHSSTRSAVKPKAAGSKSRKRKSAAYVDSEDDEGHASGPKPKNAKKPRAPRPENDAAGSGKGIHKELNCSPALAEVIGVPTSSRPQVVKRIWAYIKANELQNPQDKRQIICDERMRKIFNTQSLNMFTMNKLLGEHLWTDDQVINPQA